jgi:hypothetical protein
MLPDDHRYCIAFQERHNAEKMELKLGLGGNVRATKGESRAHGKMSTYSRESGFESCINHFLAICIWGQCLQSSWEE